MFRVCILLRFLSVRLPKRQTMTTFLRFALGPRLGAARWMMIDARAEGAKWWCPRSFAVGLKRCLLHMANGQSPLPTQQWLSHQGVAVSPHRSMALRSTAHRGGCAGGTLSESETAPLRGPGGPPRWGQEARTDGCSRQPVPVETELSLGAELTARSLQLSPAGELDYGALHALSGRSRHMNTEPGDLRVSAMLPDSNRTCWMALPSGQAQCSGFGAQCVPGSPFDGFGSPCCDTADTCAERRARHANTEPATRATPEAITEPVAPK